MTIDVMHHIINDFWTNNIYLDQQITWGENFGGDTGKDQFIKVEKIQYWVTVRSSMGSY